MAHPPRIERALLCLSEVAGWIHRKAPIQIRHDLKTVRHVLSDAEALLKRCDDDLSKSEELIRHLLRDQQSREDWADRIGRTRAVLALWLKDTKEL